MKYFNGVAFKQILHKTSIFFLFVDLWIYRSNSVCLFVDPPKFFLGGWRLGGGGGRGLNIFVEKLIFIRPTKGFFFFFFFFFISSPDKISKLSRKSIIKKFWRNYRIMHLHFILRSLIALFIHVPHVLRFLYHRI